MAKRRGRYRMTPARRAALKKAQAASARKRRKAAFIGGAKAVGSVAGTIALGAAVHGLQHHANKAAVSPVKTYNGVRGFVSRGFKFAPKVDPNAPGVALKSNRKPLRYYGTKTHRINASHGTRIRSRV